MKQHAGRSNRRRPCRRQDIPREGARKPQPVTLAFATRYKFLRFNCSPSPFRSPKIQRFDTFSPWKMNKAQPAQCACTVGLFAHEYASVNTADAHFRKRPVPFLDKHFSRAAMVSVAFRGDLVDTSSRPSSRQRLRPNRKSCAPWTVIKAHDGPTFRALAAARISIQ